MSQGFAKKKNIYIEGMITFMILLIAPYLLTLIFKGVYNLLGAIEKTKVEIQFFSYFITILFDFSFIISSGLNEPFEIVRNRLEDTFETIFIVKLKDTIKYWFSDFIEKGFFFWLYLSLIINHLLVLINCLMIHFG